jgi:hypothetical protein
MPSSCTLYLKQNSAYTGKRSDRQMSMDIEGGCENRMHEQVMHAPEGQR